MNIYCYNCGDINHYTKNCNEPKISVGVICTKINNININDYFFNNNFDIKSFNYKNILNLNKIPFYQDKIKFMLVKRRYSLNYIEFIRGIYDKNNINQISNILKLLSKEEINKILENDFDNLWTELWKDTADNKYFIKEYNLSKEKFNYLKKTNKLIKICSNINPYDSTEWEFPKGRRNYNETNLQVASREFKEETNITLDKIKIFKKLSNIVDVFKGTNNKKYKHIYYLSISNNLLEFDNNNFDNNNFDNNNFDNNFEISDINWFTWNEVINIIRPYYKSKIDLINYIYLFLINICEENKKKYENLILC